MFPKNKRFPRRLFHTAIKDGRRLSSEHLNFVLPKFGNGYAIVVPKKVARLSTTRHKLKRLLTEKIRKLALPPALIILVKSPLNDVYCDGIEKEISGLISKIKIKNTHS